jgi:valyl-tRNA synthetase
VKDFREDVKKKNLEVVSDTGEEIQMAMVLAFKGVLQMLHPFMPFFTEEIYEKMDRLGGKQMLAQSTFEKIGGLENNEKLAEEAGDNILKLTDVVTAARAARKVLGKSFHDKLVIDFKFEMGDQELAIMEKMANAEKGKLQNNEAIISGPYGSGLILIKATPEEKAAFKSSLEKSLIESEKELELLTKILTPGFKAKADPELVAEREEQFKRISAEVTGLRNELANN